MTAEEHRIKTLELTIEEQRRDYDMVDSMYERARAKNYTFLAVVLTLLTFLYTTNLPTPDLGEELTLQQKLFIPSEAYGVVLYSIAVILLLFAIRLLIMALKARPWRTAYEDDDCSENTKTYIAYLVHIKKCYDECSEVNTKSYTDKIAQVDEAFWPLIIGGILLVVLKTLGG